jgi:hypothetical protein
MANHLSPKSSARRTLSFRGHDFWKRLAVVAVKSKVCDGCELECTEGGRNVMSVV